MEGLYILIDWKLQHYCFLLFPRMYVILISKISLNLLRMLGLQVYLQCSIHSMNIAGTSLEYSTKKFHYSPSLSTFTSALLRRKLL